MQPDELRVVDANINRLKEGIRVVEDFMRYAYNNKEFSSKLKNLRHLTKIEAQELLLKNRDSINDVLKPSTESEKQRSSQKGILSANFKRAQESSRVLEEIFKLYDVNESEKYKHIRYELYDLEKQILLLI